MYDAKGSSKECSFRILAKEKVNSIHLFEGAIDLLSYATLLKEKGTDWRKINLISLSGVFSIGEYRKYRPRYSKNEILNIAQNQSLTLKNALCNKLYYFFIKMPYLAILVLNLTIKIIYL